MRTITATGVVSPDHSLTVTVPADIPPGPQTVVVVLEESPRVSQARRALQLTPPPIGLADPQCSFRRKDEYGDDGR